MKIYDAIAIAKDPHCVRVARALRLASRPDGITVTQLADEVGIHRTSAHAILAKLEAAGELVREGGVGRGGHIYRDHR